MRVVLIEDDEAARDALETQLDAWGVSFLSGSEIDAVLPECLASGSTVDMILADLRLPGKLDGIATIRHIRDRLGYVTNAVVITAEVDRADVLARLPELCVLLQKPFDSNSLYRILAARRHGLP
jgi:DNA-binding response OmpR family regulator